MYSTKLASSIICFHKKTADKAPLCSKMTQCSKIEHQQIYKLSDYVLQFYYVLILCDLPQQITKSHLEIMQWHYLYPKNLQAQ